MKPLSLRRPVLSALLPVAALTAVAVASLTPQAPTGSAAVRVQTLPLAAYVGPSGTPPAGSKVDRVIGFNDVHGYLQAGTAGNLYGSASGGSRQFANRLTALRNAAPGGAANTAVVGAGDQVGASPLASALFDDEPTLDTLGAVGLDFTSVGNHEFDKGPAALLRQQDGGCNNDGRSCLFHYNDSTSGTDADVAPNAAQGDSQNAGSFAGLGRKDTSDTTSQPYDTAGVTTGYLAANVVVHDTGKPLFPAWGIKTFPNGTKVGFIGEVLSATPTIVTPSGVAGLDFLDEASTANSYVQAVKNAGASTIVLLIHQGGSQQGAAADTVDSCDNLTGDITPIINKLDPAIGVVVSGHTHQAYDCAVTNSGTGKQVLVTSAAKYTQALTAVDLTLNPDGTLYSANAANTQVVTASSTNAKDTNASGAVAPDNCPATANAAPLASTGDDLYDHVRTIECAAVLQAAPLANRVVGAISKDIKRNGGNSGVETPLGDLIADSQLADEQGKSDTDSNSTVIAFMNPGGVRNDLLFAQSDPNKNGQVTYGQAFSVQPFGNSLTTETLTGALIYQALEQQFVACKSLGQLSFDKLLPVSSGFTYTLDLNRPACDYVVPGSAKVNGVPLDPAKTYRIEINNFLAAGGDNFTTFKQGTNQVGGDQDIDAFVNYLTARSTFVNGSPTTSVSPPAANRITVVSASPPAALPEGKLVVLLPLMGLFVMAGLGWRRSRRDRTVLAG